MSKYHKQCASSSAPVKKTVMNKKPRMIPKINIPKPEPTNKPINMVALLAPKAFCDCNHCVCRNCPDILKMLSITVSDTTCHFGSKVSHKEEDAKPSKPATSRLLDNINLDRDCTCGVVARGIRDHVHMHLGMTKRREQIKEHIETCDQDCLDVANCAKASQEAKPVIVKDNTPDPAADTEENECICDSMLRSHRRTNN